MKGFQLLSNYCECVQEIAYIYKNVVLSAKTVKPGLHISRKGVCKFVFKAVQVWLGSDLSFTSSDSSQETLAIDILKALKPYLGHSRTNMEIMQA